MRTFVILCAALGVALLGLGCADITEIEDGKAYGPVVTVKDLFTSCFLLDAGDALVLFDSCWREGTLVAGLEREGFAPDQVTHVLMTHGHADHAGGLAALPSARLLALPGEEANLDEHADAAGEIDQPLSDGETLVFGEHTVHVLATPGHTPGTAVYVVDGVVLLGDAALATSAGEITTVPEDRSEDPEQTAVALGELDERLRALEVSIDFLVPAHSGGVEGLEPLARYAP